MVPDARIIRAGTLEVEKARDDAKPAVELYTVSRVDWLQGILGVTQFAHMFWSRRREIHPPWIASKSIQESYLAVWDDRSSNQLYKYKPARL